MRPNPINIVLLIKHIKRSLICFRVNIISYQHNVIKPLIINTIIVTSYSRFLIYGKYFSDTYKYRLIRNNLFYQILVVSNRINKNFLLYNISVFGCFINNIITQLTTRTNHAYIS